MNTKPRILTRIESLEESVSSLQNDKELLYKLADNIQLFHEIITNLHDELRSKNEEIDRLTTNNKELMKKLSDKPNTHKSLHLVHHYYHDNNYKK